MLPRRHGDDAPAPRLGVVFEGDGTVLVLDYFVRGKHLCRPVRHFEVSDIFVVGAPRLLGGKGERVSPVTLLRPLLLRERRGGEVVYPVHRVARGKAHIRARPVVVEFRRGRCSYVHREVRHKRHCRFLFHVLNAAVKHIYLGFRGVKAGRKACPRSVNEFVVNGVYSPHNGLVIGFKGGVGLVLLIGGKVAHIALKRPHIRKQVLDVRLRVVDVGLGGRHSRLQVLDVALGGRHPPLQFAHIARHRRLVGLEKRDQLLEVLFGRVIGDGVFGQGSILHREARGIARVHIHLRGVDRTRRARSAHRRLRDRDLAHALQRRHRVRNGDRGVVEVVKGLDHVPAAVFQGVGREGRHRRVVRGYAVRKGERRRQRHARIRVYDAQIRGIVRALKHPVIVEPLKLAFAVQ